MPNLMDKQFNNFQNNIPFEFQNAINQARQNPKAFEEHVKRTNPQAYQQALNIMNLQNPQAAILQMMQAKGINPAILGMLGIKQVSHSERTAEFDIIYFIGGIYYE